MPQVYERAGSILRPVNVLVAIFAALFGLAFGSFLNVCISRLPRHQSIVRPASRCPACGQSIRATDNIPLVSWMLLRGRCRFCGWRIPWRYPLVELATAMLFLLCYLIFGVTLSALGMVALCFLLLGLAVMDAETLLLPDSFTLPGIALGILYSGLHGGWRNALFAAAYGLGATVLILLIRGIYWLARRREGMGLGDAKLLALIAAWLGPRLSLLVLFLGVIAAASFGILLAVRNRRKEMRNLAIPFGSFLCAAAIYAVFYGNETLAWYVQFFR